MFCIRGPELKKKFLELFGCESALDCDIFAGADSVESTLAQLREIAVTRGIYKSFVVSCYPPLDPAPPTTPHLQQPINKMKQQRSADSSIEDFDIASILPPHQRKRLKASVTELALLRAGGYTGAYCSDLVPSEGFDRSSRMLPSFTKNTRLVNLSKGPTPHIYTNDELDFSQGWPSLHEYTGGYEQCMPCDITKLSTSTRRGLRGNSMHLAAIATFVQFCLGISNKMKTSKNAIGINDNMTT